MKMKNLTMKSKKLIIILLTILVLCLTAALFGCSRSPSGLPSGDSQTNVQVKGVDESDITKTIEQGGVKYIAIIRNDGLTISKAVDGEITVVKKNLISDFYNGEMLIYENVLAVIGGGNDLYKTNYNVRKSAVIRLYDISNLSNAETELPLLRTIKVADNNDGYKQRAARLYEGKLYLLTRPHREAYYEYNVDDSVKGEITLDRQKPRDDSNDNNYYSRTSEFGAILLSVDLANPSADYTAAFYDCPVNDMYFSAEGVYFISECYITSRKPTRFLFFRVYTRKTVHLNYLFEVDRNTMQIKTVSDPITSPRFNYAIADRYSLHATANNLFAVVCEEDSSYSVYAFGKDLKIVGSVGGVARNESLHGVTFEEDYCYFVTFRNVDPLFKVDISDPKNMKVVGELTIPGFSEYLCEFGGYKIGLGYDGNFGRIKVSLFDVSYNQPTEINNIVFYYSHSTPEAMYNPRAILVSEAHNMFGFAMDGKYYVFGVEKGKLVQRAVLSQNNDVYYYYYVGRGVIIDDYLYTLSDSEIRSYAASDFEFMGKWTLELSYPTYTVNFDTDDGTVIRPQTVAQGMNIEKPKNPVKHGYTFKGWYYIDSYGNETLFNFSILIYQDYDLYAVWTEL